MTEINRRRLIVGGLAAAATAVAAACSPRRRNQQAQATREPTATGSTTRPRTPSCGDDPTPAQGEGPFFTPNSPERTNLREGVDGTPLVVSGAVMTTACEPVSRALIDVWQADDRGEYDNEGDRLRGHLFSDDEGRYRFETIVPAQYSGRTRHIHVKVQAPNGPVLTTQLYFPDDPANDTDGIFDPALVMNLREGENGGQAGGFDFVIDT